MYKVLRRLDASILFKIYCWIKTGREIEGQFLPFTKFHYSRWSEDGPIVEALDRLVGLASDTGFVFKKEDGGIRVTSADSSRIVNYFKQHLDRMLRQKSLSRADDEDLNECTSLIKFERQTVLFQKYLSDQYEEYGENISIIRMMFKQDIGRPYQQFCFEELIMGMVIKGFLEITSLTDKQLRDEDTGNIFVSPIVNVRFNPIDDMGIFKFNLINQVVSYGASSWSLESPTNQERAQAIFLRTLIQAKGEYVKTKEIRAAIESEHVGRYGSQVSGLYARLPKDVRRNIRSGSGKKSPGYKILAISESEEPE